MAERTEIPWTKSTFNPWIGCTKVSVSGTHGAGGCDNCYAEVQDARNIFAGTTHWGPGVPRLRTSASNWNQVRRWNKEAPNTEFAGRKGFWPVFSASLGDIFDNDVPDEWRRDFWALVKECKNLTFQIVTKRISNAARMLPPDWGDGYSNVWLISTVVNQYEADRDIPKLLSIPAAVHGLSMEPLLGAVDLRTIRLSNGSVLDALMGIDTAFQCGYVNKLGWVIAGGESNNLARPMHPDWVRGLKAQCFAAGVPFFFKQWGGWMLAEVEAGGDLGGEMHRDTVRIVKFAGENDGHFRRCDALMRKVGKKLSGRLLDGVLHGEYPEISHVC